MSYPQQFASESEAREWIGRQQPTTTPGLRKRLAEALREDLRRAIAPVEAFPGAPTVGGMGRTEYDLADALLPVVTEYVAEVEADRERLRRKSVARARALNHAERALLLTQIERNRLKAEVEALRTAAALRDDSLARLRARVAELETELAALKTVTPGYCPQCGRGDCAPSADQWYTQWQRADQADARLAAALELLEDASPAVCDLPHATIAEETTCDRAAETGGEA